MICYHKNWKDKAKDPENCVVNMTYTIGTMPKLEVFVQHFYQWRVTYPSIVGFTYYSKTNILASSTNSFILSQVHYVNIDIPCLGTSL